MESRPILPLRCAAMLPLRADPQDQAAEAAVLSGGRGPRSEATHTGGDGPQRHRDGYSSPGASPDSGSSPGDNRQQDRH